MLLLLYGYKKKNLHYTFSRRRLRRCLHFAPNYMSIRTYPSTRLVHHGPEPTMFFDRSERRRAPKNGKVSVHGLRVLMSTRKRVRLNANVDRRRTD